MKFVKIKGTESQIQRRLQKLRALGVTEEQIRMAGIHTTKYWTKDRCIEEARKYKTQAEWRRKGKGISAAQKNRWMEECTAHMKRLVMPSGYWTKKRCVKEAKKYKTRSEWHKNSSTSFVIARKNGWHHECVKHMQIKKMENGYWTIDKCIAISKKFSSKMEWKKNDSSSYHAASKNGWLDICTRHIVSIGSNSGYWTKQKCLKEAKKYKILSHWSKSPGRGTISYNVASKNGWLKECTKHMKKITEKRPIQFWKSKKNCIKEAKKYKTRTEWLKKSKNCYIVARKYGWYSECVKHMQVKKMENGYWTKQKCLNEAKKYSTVKEWREKSSASYAYSVRKKWLKDISKNMGRSQKESGYWTKERCIKEAKKYATRSNWSAGSGTSYNLAHKKGWFKQCVSHMKPIHYNPVLCVELKKVFYSPGEAAKKMSINKTSNIFSAAKNGWKCGGYHWKFVNDYPDLKD